MGQEGRLPEVYVAARELMAEAIATWQEALLRFVPASRAGS